MSKRTFSDVLLDLDSKLSEIHNEISNDIECQTFINEEDTDQVKDEIRSLKSTISQIQARYANLSESSEPPQFINLKVFEPIFNDFPKLEKLPFYSWGRYHIYELAGEEFESYLDGPRFVSFYHRIEDKKGFDPKILAEIDKVCSERYEEVMDGEYLPGREDCVKRYSFDDRGGLMLVVCKKDGKLELECVKCDSPE